MTILIAAAHAVAAPPHSDQEVERHQHQVEEEDEQREVLREERAEHGGLGERHVEVEQPRALRLAAQRRPQRARANTERRQQRSGTRFSPSIAELVVDAERRDPGVVGDVLQARCAGVEVGEQRRPRRPSARDAMPGERRPQRAARPGSSERRRARAGERQEEQDREVRSVMRLGSGSRGRRRDGRRAAAPRSSAGSRSGRARTAAEPARTTPVGAADERAVDEHALERRRARSARATRPAARSGSRSARRSTTC